MPERTVTCGECRASKKIPDADWNTVQAPAVDEWQHEHEAQAHGGEDVAVELEPNPFNDD